MDMNAHDESRTCIDLFCGAGGMAEGFRLAGFKCLWANDFEEEALETFRVNHRSTQTQSGPIQEIDARRIRDQLGIAPGELDVLVGGPPCQGFSTYGQRDPDDERNRLFSHVLRFAREFEPKAVVIENVVGILSMEGGLVLEEITEGLRREGYSSTTWTLDAADFGVPQRRRRVFVVGLRGGTEVISPSPMFAAATVSAAPQENLFASSWLPPWRTVADAISDLPEASLLPKETQKRIAYDDDPRTEYQKQMRAGAESLLHHSSKQMLGLRRLRLALLRPGDYGSGLRERILSEGLPEEVIGKLLGDRAGLRSAEECRTEDRVREIEIRALLRSGNASSDELAQLLDAGGFANKYRRLDWLRPSHTLVAHMARDCSDFVHPEYDRFVTVREAARLQSFPDRYEFPGSQFRQFRQIGNAVPPILGRAVASTVAASLAPRQVVAELSKKVVAA
jgi:DNA (cytosine-5)-methyltransferase 1